MTDKERQILIEAINDLSERIDKIAKIIDTSKKSKNHIVQLPKEFVEDINAILKVMKEDNVEKGLDCIKEFIKTNKCSEDIPKLIKSIDSVILKVQSSQRYKKLDRNNYGSDNLVYILASDYNKEISNCMNNRELAETNKYTLSRYDDKKKSSLLNNILHLNDIISGFYDRKLYILQKISDYSSPTKYKKK